MEGCQNEAQRGAHPGLNHFTHLILLSSTFRQYCNSTLTDLQSREREMKKTTPEAFFFYWGKFVRKICFDSYALHGPKRVDLCGRSSTLK
jgi:hypothetical protein